MTAESVTKIQGVVEIPRGQVAREPLISKMLLLFMLAMVLANLGGNMYGPLLPLYLKSLNASVVQVGLFFTLSQIVPLALQILGGWISDLLGRLRSIALGSIAGLLSYVGLILAPVWQWVLVGEGFNSMTRSLVAPSFSAFIAEQSSESNRARVFGITQTIFMVVSVIGPPLGGWLADTYGFKRMLLCAAFLYFLATIIRFGMAFTTARTHEAPPEKLSLASLRLNLGTMLGLVLAGGLITWILLTDGVRDVGYALSFNLLPVYLQDIGKIKLQQIGWLESLLGVTMMLVTIPAGWLADKKGERLGIMLGFLFQFAALMVFVKASSFWGFAATWILLGIGFGIMDPAYQSLISKAVPKKVRGTAFGLFGTSLGVVSLPAPAIGAQLWQRVGPHFPFTLTAWMSLLAILPVWLKFKTPDLTPNPPSRLRKGGRGDRSESKKEHIMIATNHTIQSITLPDAPAIPGLAFRGFRGEADYPKMLAVIAGSKDFDQIERADTVEDIARNYAHLTNSDPARDMLFAEIDGYVIGYSRVSWFDVREGIRIYQHFAFLLPEWRRKGLGRAILHYNERRLRQIAAGQTFDGPRQFDTEVFESEAGRIALLKSEGYEPVRFEFVMVRPNLDDLPEAPMPPGLEVRPVKPEHYRAIHAASMEAFQDHWGFSEEMEEDIEALLENPDNDPSLWRVAWDGDQVAGMVLSFIDPDENRVYNRKRGWTEDISVRRPWRKRGLASALIVQSMQAIKERGMTEAALGVDGQNLTGALQLYERLGYRVVKRSWVYRKPLG